MKTIQLNRPALATAGQILAQQCHAAAIASGAWEAANSVTGTTRTDNDVLLLAMAELSRAAEAGRFAGGNEHTKHTALSETLGQAVIHIFDLAGKHDLDLGNAVAILMKRSGVGVEPNAKPWHFPIDSTPALAAPV